MQRAVPEVEYCWADVWSKYNRAYLRRWFHREAESDLTVWINYNPD
jgi:hypothetical protein